jgi:long-chain acyl-CoA synthetase
MNIANFLARAARVFPEHPAISVGDKVHATYGNLARRVSAMAHSLRHGLRLQPSERVALFMGNCAEYLELLYTGWHAGLTLVPINAKLHPREVEFTLENSGARLCFVTPDLAPALASVATALPHLTRIIDVGTAEYRTLGQHQPLPIHRSNPDDIAWLFYTSGTTGRPKGAMLSHRNLMAMTFNYFTDVDRIAATDCIVHAAPISHGSGMYNFAHMAMAANQVIPESGHFDPAEIFALIRRWPGVSFFAAPTMVKRLTDYAKGNATDTTHLKTIVYGGGPMYMADIKEALALFGLKFVQIYGQGESPMTITSLSKFHLGNMTHPRYEDRLGSVGVAQTGVEVRVADPEDRTLPPGEIGEVLVRGDVVMQGYWKNSEATAATLKGGWLHTGDLGMLDEDGFLTLKDRSKDLIISAGSNIYPREVEEVLLRHPMVREVSVVGRPHPEWGEEVVAFVVCEPDAQVTESELDALCLDNIARFKRPREYRFIASLPKNNYGKVLKTDLREVLRMGQRETAGQGA